MKMRNEQTAGGIIVKAWLRRAGEMTGNDGKPIKWGDDHQVLIVPFEESIIQKYVIDPDCVHSVLKILDDVHWGALVSLTLRNKKVIDVQVEVDSLADFYECND